MKIEDLVVGNFIKEEGAIWLITDMKNYLNEHEIRFGIKCIWTDGFWEVGEEVLDSDSNLGNYKLVSGDELNRIKAELL